MRASLLLKPFFDAERAAEKSGNREPRRITHRRKRRRSAQEENPMATKRAKKKSGQPEKVFRPVIEVYEELGDLFDALSEQYDEELLHYVRDDESMNADARLQHRRKAMYQNIENELTGSVDHPMYIGDNPPTCSKSVAQRIANRFLHYYHPTCLSAHRYFDNGVSSTVSIWICERNTNEGKKTRRSPFQHAPLETYLNTTARDEDIYAVNSCLLYTSPSPRDRTRSRMPSSA